MWTCEIEVAILFLMLASVMTRAWKGLLEDSIAKSSSWWTWDLRLSSLYLLNKWNEKQLEKMSIILHPEENSGLRGSKEGNTLLKQLSMLTTRPLISSH